MAKNSQVIWGVVIGAVLVALAGGLTMYATDSGPFSSADEGGGGTVVIQQPGGGDQLATCDSSTTPDLDINAYDARNVGTALTEATNLYRKVGDIGWTSFTAGTAITSLEKGAQYEVVMGISTSDFTDNAYGPHFITDPIPCAELTVVEKAEFDDDVETDLTSTFFNADGDASAEVFVADQTQTVSLKILAGSDDFFGNPYIKESTAVHLSGQDRNYPNVICFELNSTAWDVPEKVWFKGVDMKQVAKPQRLAGSATDNAYCYTAPLVDDSLMEEDRYFIRLNSDDSTAPAVDDTAHIFAANFYINSDDGKVYWGIENEDGTAVGTDAADTVALDFT